MSKTLREKLEEQAAEIIDTIVEKDAAYGSSWKRYGGHSAFFNLMRKADRAAEMASQHQYDLFEAAVSEEEGVDTIQDLIAYGLLTLTEIHIPGNGIEVEEHDDQKIEGEPGPEYVNQD